MFPKTPAITLHDPLAEFLGAGDGLLTYTFDDAVKLAGHGCPTVAGAFLLAKRAVELLYPGETPRRGDIRIEVPGPVDAGVNGPIAQILTLLTGAAAENGFHGLGGQFVRSGLLHFGTGGGGPYRFHALSKGTSVALVYDPSPFPPAAAVQENMPLALSGRATEAQRQAFRDGWRQRVLAILADGGATTIRVV